MATTSYNGSWGDSYSLNTTRTCYLSGGGGASGIINSVTVDLIFSTNAYSPHYYLTITLLTNSGNIEIEDEVKMTSDDYSFASRSFTFSNVSLSQANSITGISIKCTGASSSSGSASKVFVKSSVSVVVDYTIPSKLATPTISTGTTMTTDSTVAISWAASWNTTANTLTAYELQYADSSNGSSFSAWTTYYTYGTGTRSVSASLPAAKGWRKFRVRALGSAGSDYYSDWSESSAVCRVAMPTTPGSFAVSPTIWDSGNVALSWSASAVTGASISRYYVEYRLKKYGSSFGSWTALTNTTALKYSYNPGLSKGDVIAFRVRSLSSDGIHSAYTSEATVSRQTDVPINLTPAAGWYTLLDLCAWELPTTINLAGTICQYAYTINSGVTWSAWNNASGNSFNAAALFDSVSSGNYFCYKVRAVQTNGDITDAAISGILYKNTASAAPVILSPVPSSPISPGAFWAILRITRDINGHSMTVTYSKDSGEFAIIANDITDSCIVAAKLTAGGAYRFRVTDEYGAYSEVARTITVTAETYTDSPVTAGTTRIKAAHINEIRSRVEQLCAFYGLSAPSWNESIIAGTTSIKHYPAHVAEIRSTLTAIYQKINGLGAGVIIPTPAWSTTLDDTKPKAAAIEELRAAAKAI